MHIGAVLGAGRPSTSGCFLLVMLVGAAQIINKQESKSYNFKKRYTAKEKIKEREGTQ